MTTSQHTPSPDPSRLNPDTSGFSAAPTRGGAGGHVPGSSVSTNTGSTVGTVVDVLAQARRPGNPCAVIGYEIAATNTRGHHRSASGTSATRNNVLLSLPGTLAVSAQQVLVPARATEFVDADRAGLGVAAGAVRVHVRGAS